MKWTEPLVVRTLIDSQLFQRKLVVVPRCHFAGPEADLLAVHAPSMKLIDVEVKVSRADLLADPKKDKWWHRSGWRNGNWAEERMREWPPKVWRHYYALPADIWHRKTEDLITALPPSSGVITLYENHNGKLCAAHARRAKPNPGALPISAEDAVDLARLCGLRMWDALLKQEPRRFRNRL